MTSIFDLAIKDYHEQDSVDGLYHNSFCKDSIEAIAYRKCWVDNIQWHLEDIIRKPDIEPAEALEIKRRIDKMNQERTDLVELIDDYFVDRYKKTKPKYDAKINTESPGCAIDRLSILAIKIYHWKYEAERKDADEDHKANCNSKLSILIEQKEDLKNSIKYLVHEIASGKKIMKVYRQMKMYNDPELNPSLYRKKQ
jgi:hypothetical protein